MLHVKIDIVPFGEEEGREQIKELYIANVGRVDGDVCKYDVYLKDPRFMKKRVVDGTYEHARADGAFICVEKAIASLEKK